jgi:acetoin:2,6-dichlorophenolindophenol oxidoreductase subunit alpha
MLDSALHALGPNGVLEMYRRMLAIRVFETTAEELIDTGELIGVIHTSVGQEATCVGAGMGLAADDYITGNHRSHGHPIGKGAELAKLMAELFGKKTGVCNGFGGSMHLADFTVGCLGETAIVGSSLPIAVGAALSSKLTDDGKVCLAFFGDGASNAGAFHESMNMAAIWDLPLIFMCENNGYAITTRHDAACSVEHISQRGTAYEMPAKTVDGQDVFAVWNAVHEAADLARAGRGPSLIEAITYRYGDHSYLMNRLPYRTAAEIDEWRKNDPIENFARTVTAQGVATEGDLSAIRVSVEQEVADAVAFARASDYPELDDLWDHMYTDPRGFPQRRHNDAWRLDRLATRWRGSRDGDDLAPGGQSRSPRGDGP